MRKGVPEIRASSSAPTLNLSQLSLSKRPTKPSQLTSSGPVKKPNPSSKDSPSPSSDSDDPLLPRADIITKLKNYDSAWFKDVCDNHPEFFIDSKHNAEIILGYNHAFIRGSKQLCFARNDRLVSLDIDENEHFSRMLSVGMRGAVTAMATSLNFKYVVACVGDRTDENFSIAVLNAQKEFAEEVLFSCEVAAEKLCLDDNSDNVVLFAPNANRNAATIACYALFTGHKIASVELDNHERSDVWEITLCPTDEHIMCVLSSSTAYLLRNTGPLIQTFSSISLFDVSCHVWSTDVTLAFGTHTGSIFFYRETLALNTLPEKLRPTDFVARFHQTVFLTLVANRIVLVCPVNNAQMQWDRIRAILAESPLYVPTMCNYPLCANVLIDASSRIMVVVSDECIQKTEIQFLGVTQENGFTLLVAKHSAAIAVVRYELLSASILSVDVGGFLLVHSMQTGRILSWTKIEDFVNADFLNGGHHLLIATKSALKCFSIEYKSIVERRTISKMSIEMMALSVCRSRCVVASQQGFTLIDIANSYVTVADVAFDFTNKIEFLEWSTTNDQFAVISATQHLYVFGHPQGNLLWKKDLKLSFLTSVSFRENVLFAINSKFFISQIAEGANDAGRTVSCDGITYSTTSTILCSTEHCEYVGLSDGNIIEVLRDSSSKVRVLERPTSASCTTLRYDERTKYLYAGYEDGVVAKFTLEVTDVPITGFGGDSVLCPLDTVEHNKRLVNLLDVERNNLRIQTTQLLEKYRQKTEKEMMATSAELKTVIDKLQEQIEELSIKNETDVASSQDALKNLMRMHKENVDSITEQHKKLFSQQIRFHIEQQKKTTDEIKQLQVDYKQITYDNRQEIEVLRSEFNIAISEKDEKLNRAVAKSKKLKKELAAVKIEREQMESALREQLANEEEKLRLFSKQCKDERIQLKANMLIANEEVKDFKEEMTAKDDENQQLRERMQHFEILLADKDKQIAQYFEEIKQRMANQSSLQKKIVLVQKNSVKAEKRLEEEIGIRKQVEKRLKTYETKIEDAVKNMYRTNALEKNVLELQALLISKK